MRRKLLVIAMVATMVASTLLVGCGSNDTSETTTKASAEQNNNNVVDPTKDNTTKEENTSKVEDVVSYDEVFYDEPDWEVEYEGKSEAYIEELKCEYAAMKWVFEDMTQNFKHKKEVTAIEKINLDFIGDLDSLTFVCDIDNVMVEGLTNSDGEPIVWKKDLYPEFAGFNLKDVDCTYWSNKGVYRVGLGTPYVAGQYPLVVTAYVVDNGDGTYTYKEIYFGSNIYE